MIRRSMRNCSVKDRARMTVPDLAAVDWDGSEYLGWRDTKAPLRAYLVRVRNDGVIGVAMRAPELPVRRTAQCSLCHCVHRANVSLFAARLTGRAGRDENTVGTYVCADLACSDHVRASLPATRDLPDPAPLVAERRAELGVRVDRFLDRVLAG